MPCVSTKRFRFSGKKLICSAWIMSPFFNQGAIWWFRLCVCVCGCAWICVCVYVYHTTHAIVAWLRLDQWATSPKLLQDLAEKWFLSTGITKLIGYKPGATGGHFATLSPLGKNIPFLRIKTKLRSWERQSFCCKSPRVGSLFSPK